MSSPNYSIYAIPAFYVLALVPKAYCTALINRATNGRFNNANPRGESVWQNYQKSMDAATYAKIERALAAHSNAMENLPIFFAAVICANLAGLDLGTVNAVCGVFLFSRALHTALYITVTNKKLAPARSITWVASVVCCLYLLIKSGNVLVGGSVPLSLKDSRA